MAAKGLKLYNLDNTDFTNSKQLINRYSFITLVLDLSRLANG